ncbi:MAG: TetR/AcrR family transcriptional regulator [Alphaproteobacteria bacterium]|nr:TetR/AcrR family transcriptional regulator [Alphaproteobacteria bacterium]MCB9697300.1 TetR/AcrR family transcriptional regulator [Alphaproteobacteria bacterium]
MAQVLKPEVRHAILEAATKSFAAKGYAGATMSEIASRAGLSTGNVYRYFSGKDELFDTVLDDAFVEAFDQRLAARVGALASLSDLRVLDGAAAQRQADLLAFWIEHRLKVVILLDRAAGTRREGAAARFVTGLTDEVLGGRPVAPQVRFVLERIFDGTRRTMVAILEQHEEEAAIRAAFDAFWSFQLAGLAGFTQGVLA